MREKTIEQAVCRAARAAGWETRKFVSPSQRGVPDRMFFREGVMFFIEFKAPGKKPTKLQAHEMGVLERHGFRCFVVDSVAGGFRVLDEMSR